MNLEDLFKTMAFKTPPVSLDAAVDRMQLLYSDDETIAECRDAAGAPPDDDQKAINRISAAGLHCTNLIGMKWKNVDQIKAAMAEFNWKCKFYCDTKTMNFGISRLIIGIARATDHQMLLWLHEEPYAITVLGAKLLKASEKADKTLKDISELIQEYCDHDEI